MPGELTTAEALHESELDGPRAGPDRRTHIGETLLFVKDPSGNVVDVARQSAASR